MWPQHCTEAEDSWEASGDARDVVLKSLHDVDLAGHAQVSTGVDRGVQEGGHPIS